jgi:anti-sigma B factor antagonist
MAGNLPGMSGEPPLGGRHPSVTTERFATQGVVVRVTGDLDLALAPRLDRAIAREIAGGRRHFAIDLGGATFLDCASVGTLVRALAPLRAESDASVVLGGATGPVKRILSVLALDAIFEVVEDVSQVTGVSVSPGRRGVEGWRWAAGPGRLRALRGSHEQTVQRRVDEGPPVAGTGHR